MLSSNDHTLSNLRLMAGVKVHEYIQTDCEGNILSYLGHNFVNCVTNAVYGENWHSTLKCIRKLYVYEMPDLIEKAIEKGRVKTLKKIHKLLTESLGGLTNLKTVYQGDDMTAHINTLIDDFCKGQIEVLEEKIVELDAIKAAKKLAKEKVDEVTESLDALAMPTLKRTESVMEN